MSTLIDYWPLWAWLFGSLVSLRFFYGALREKYGLIDRRKCSIWHDRTRDPDDHPWDCYENSPAAVTAFIVSGSIFWPVVSVGYGLYKWTTFKPRKTRNEKLAEAKVKAEEAETAKLEAQRRTSELETEAAELKYKLQQMGIES